MGPGSDIRSPLAVLTYLGTHEHLTYTSLIQVVPHHAQLASARVVPTWADDSQTPPPKNRCHSVYLLKLRDRERSLTKLGSTASIGTTSGNDTV
eukprot:scaffold9308_cov133-Skeletonema_dohrnii-CCMP3373.AAC.2